MGQTEETERRPTIPQAPDKELQLGISEKVPTHFVRLVGAARLTTIVAPEAPVVPAAAVKVNRIRLILRLLLVRLTLEAAVVELTEEIRLAPVAPAS